PRGPLRQGHGHRAGGGAADAPLAAGPRPGGAALSRARRAGQRPQGHACPRARAREALGRGVAGYTFSTSAAALSAPTPAGPAAGARAPELRRDLEAAREVVRLSRHRFSPL